MELSGRTIGFAVTGSFCTLSKVAPVIESLIARGADVLPVFSENTVSTDTRFGKAADFIDEIESITHKKIISTIDMAEHIGPKKLIDALVIAPCTGNTLAKLANGITDTCVTLAAKANLRNLRPVIIGVSSNDALGANAKNLGLLINMKNIFFVPFGQDDPVNKEKSLVCSFDMILPTVEAALEGKQIQPMLINKG